MLCAALNPGTLCNVVQTPQVVVGGRIYSREGLWKLQLSPELVKQAEQEALACSAEPRAVSVANALGGALVTILSGSLLCTL